MGFKLPWFGKKQDNTQAVPPMPAAPSTTPPVADMSVPPVSVTVPSEMSQDGSVAGSTVVPPEASAEEMPQSVPEQPVAAFSGDSSVPTSPAADLMGQTASVSTEAPSLAEHDQSSVESVPTLSAAPAPEEPVADVAVPQSDVPTGATPEQPEEAPKNQF